MSRHAYWKLLGTLFAAGALLILGGAGWPGTARADDPVKITVKLTDTGYSPATVEVTQGQAVEITFVWAQTTHLEDEHVIVIEGYKVESETIDKNHTSSTVKLVATKTGTFAFTCDVECDLHSTLQNGKLKVNPAGAGSSGSGSGLTATKLVIDPTTGISTRVDSVALLASLVDKDGNPVPKADVTFLAEQTFAGTTGLMEIGTARTGPAGTAQIVYHPTRSDDEKIVVRFEGQGVYDATESTLTLPGNRLFGPVEEATSAPLHGLKGWAKGGLVVVIAGVWVMFGFIVYQAVKLSRAAKEV